MRVFEYFVRDEAREIRETAEVLSRDFNVKSRVFKSLNYSWVESTVFYRYRVSRKKCTAAF